jgi:murein L,D-transpeptidase YafK
MGRIKKRLVAHLGIVACLGIGGAVAGLPILAHWPEAAPLPAGILADQVVVRKAERRLQLLSHGRMVKEYPISLGSSPLSAKGREGDGRTPEGRYTIDFHKEDSAFHRALHISYPSPKDRAAAAARGEDPGGLIMIHGLPKGLAGLGRLHRWRDWTQGCIAVTNAEIREIYRAVPDGTPIVLFP